MELAKKKVKVAKKPREHIDPRMEQAIVILRAMLSSFRMPQTAH